MTEEEIIIGDAVFAEFLDMEITAIYDGYDVWVKTDIHNGLFEETNARFTCSFDWIMKVVEKIEAAGFIVNSYRTHCKILPKFKEQHDQYKPLRYSGEDRLSSIYGAALVFVKRLKQQSTTNV